LLLLWGLSTHDGSDTVLAVMAVWRGYYLVVLVELVCVEQSVAVVEHHVKYHKEGNHLNNHTTTEHLSWILNISYRVKGMNQS
jgi:hypothetical protein